MSQQLRTVNIFYSEFLKFSTISAFKVDKTVYKFFTLKKIRKI